MTETFADLIRGYRLGDEEAARRLTRALALLGRPVWDGVQQFSPPHDEGSVGSAFAVSTPPALFELCWDDGTPGCPAAKLAEERGVAWTPRVPGPVVKSLPEGGRQVEFGSFRLDLLPAPAELARRLGVPLASETPVPDGV